MGNSLVNADAKTSKFRSIEDIIKDPLLKTKLNNLVDEAVRGKLRIHTEQETIKDLRNLARDDLGLNPKLFNYYVSAVFNNDYAARKETLDQFTTLIDTIMALLPATHSSFQGDDD